MDRLVCFYTKRRKYVTRLSAYFNVFASHSEVEKIIF